MRREVGGMGDGMGWGRQRESTGINGNQRESTESTEPTEPITEWREKSDDWPRQGLRSVSDQEGVAPGSRVNREQAGPVQSQIEPVRMR